MKSENWQRIRNLENRCEMFENQPSRALELKVSEELARDDPERLAGFLTAAWRAGLLNQPPDPDDDSQIAKFLRAAWGSGLASKTKLILQTTHEKI
jgi:hypothetical protein